MLESLPPLAGALILDEQQAQLQYGIDTGGARRDLVGAIVPANAQQIGAIIKWANTRQQPVWPLSGGRNFGYGTALPVGGRNLILDMSRLKGIRFIAESQTVEIEPGVTQGDLSAFLDENHLDYLVPTTGAGPHGSLIGNALDGGYGLTPVSDHFDGLVRMAGYWGSGAAFDHPFALSGAADMANRWAAGMGPDYRSLLRQGNFGIVTKAWLQLTRRPEAMSLVIVQWRTQAQYLQSQDEMSRIMEDVPQLTGMISMSAVRAMAAMPAGPLAHAPTGADRQAYLDRCIAERKMAAWTALGTLYGSKRSIAGACHDIRRRLRKHGASVMIMTPRKARVIGALKPLLPASLRAKVDSLGNAMNMLEGRPVAEFLQLAYALDSRHDRIDANRHPARDGQGILWYAPLVPLSEQGMRDYVKMVEPILAEHGFDNLLAATTRSSRASIATLPLLFRKTPEDIGRAKACYRRLVQAGKAQGMPPYRMGIDFMTLCQQQDHADTQDFGRSMKQALDPNDIIAPGRYVAAQRIAMSSIDSDLELPVNELELASLN